MEASIVERALHSGPELRCGSNSKVRRLSPTQLRRVWSRVMPYKCWWLCVTLSSPPHFSLSASVFVGIFRFRFVLFFLRPGNFVGLLVYSSSISRAPVLSAKRRTSMSLRVLRTLKIPVGLPPSVPPPTTPLSSVRLVLPMCFLWWCTLPDPL